MKEGHVEELELQVALDQVTRDDLLGLIRELVRCYYDTLRIDVLSKVTLSELHAGLSLKHSRADVLVQVGDLFLHEQRHVSHE